MLVSKSRFIRLFILFVFFYDKYSAKRLLLTVVRLGCNHFLKNCFTYLSFWLDREWQSVFLWAENCNHKIVSFIFRQLSSKNWELRFQFEVNCHFWSPTIFTSTILKWTENFCSFCSFYLLCKVTYMAATPWNCLGVGSFQAVRAKTGESLLTSSCCLHFVSWNATNLRKESIILNTNWLQKLKSTQFLTLCM